MTLTVDRLKELLHYEPTTGLFTVIRRRRNQLQIGDTVGHKVQRGYVSIHIDGRGYLAHRLAWLYMTGKWPIAEIDHANCDTSDNRIANLREASRSQNVRNSRLRCNNHSGYKGVRLHKKTGLWQARITLKGHDQSLGYFRRPEDAHEAYCKAAVITCGEFARAA